MKNIDFQNSITENDTQDLPLICVNPHTSSAEIFLGGDDFYVKMEADSGEFLGTLFPLGVRTIPLNSPSIHFTDEDPGSGSGNSPKFSQ